jgi:uncharacterized protein YprB with RNaseH-like and TPR domain
MSMLQERLNRLKKNLISITEAAKRSEEAAALEAETQVHHELRKTDQASTPGEEWDDLGVALESNEWGTFLKRRRSYPLHHKHGQYAFGELSENVAELKAFYPTADIDCGQLLFFDTETTGLGVGAGNVPFMIGIGFYEQDHFITEQFFIRNPAEELAMLFYFNACLQRFTHIVSYNGRSFDWPILLNRYVLNRMKLSNPGLLQLDLLYASRSFWRNTLSSCRLGKIEEERLGFTRIDDVPGSMAPALYFQYLAERRPSLMQGLFIHNEHDILSLASLAVHFSLALSGRLAYAAMEAEELFRIGVWLDKMGKSPFAEEAFTHLLARPSASASSHWLALAAFYKKKGAELKAVQLWSQYIALERNELSFVPAEPYIELAMFFEHRKKDYATALDHAQKAYEQARRQALFLRLSIGRSNSNHKPSKQQELCDQLLKRIERLRKKLANSVTKLQF